MHLLELSSYEIDGVGPIDNTPFTNKLYHCVQIYIYIYIYIIIENTIDMWQVTCDMLNVTMTCDMWHVTWYATGGGSWTFSKNVSSLSLRVLECRSFEDVFTKNESLTDSLTDFMTMVLGLALVTPGLLKITRSSTSQFQISGLLQFWLQIYHAEQTSKEKYFVAYFSEIARYDIQTI